MFCPARHFLWLGADIFLIKPAFLAFSLPLCGFYYSLRLIFFLVKLAFHAFSLSCIIHLAIHRQTLLYLLAGLAFSASGFTLLCFTVSAFTSSSFTASSFTVSAFSASGFTVPPLFHLLLPYPPFLYPPSQSSPCVASLLLIPLRLLLFLFLSILLRFLLCLTLRLFLRLLLLLYLRIFLRFRIYLLRRLFLLCLHFFRLRDIF